MPQEEEIDRIFYKIFRHRRQMTGNNVKFCRLVGHLVTGFFKDGLFKSYIVAKEYFNDCRTAQRLVYLGKYFAFN